MDVKIGTRGSALALAQTQQILGLLRSHHPSHTFSHVVVETQGDRKQGTPKAREGDKEDWVKELEAALLEGKISAALHSGKDIPSVVNPETVLIPVARRASPNDAFIGRMQPNGRRVSYSEVTEGDVVGTASLRRGALLRKNISGARVQEIRGNVPTRIEKLDHDDGLRGIVLAAAGLERLALPGVEYDLLPTHLYLPAVNQGILVIQVRKDSHSLQPLLGGVCSAELHAVFESERAAARVLEGDCNSAMGIFAEVQGIELTLRACVFSHDGSRALEASGSGPLADSSALGEQVGKELLSKGAKELLNQA